MKLFGILLEFMVYLFGFQTVEDTMHVVVPALPLGSQGDFGVPDLRRVFLRAACGRTHHYT